MIDYKPYRKYTEIVDYIPEQKKVLKGKIIGYVLLFLYIGILGWMFMGTRWSAIGAFFIAPIIGIVFLFIWSLSSPGEPRLRADYANVIKDIIGYDFGDDFKLLFTGSHDYEEYLYIFSEESFTPFKRYLNTIPDGKDDKTGRVVDHCFKGEEGQGFSLVENRLGSDLCGSVESIEVDYMERTLKHKFVVY